MYLSLCQYLHLLQWCVDPVVRAAGGAGGPGDIPGGGAGHPLLPSRHSKPGTVLPSCFCEAVLL